ncbi:hypothetical protein C7M61_004623 [Candidozyma pseudohaemuli]|uniref:Uncharacterized protein n=1 Tax=Candidozyma pseudohaemuli TaxID=418784 RepID=A0A2P7YHE3_9ASCO|nr:hypothetical protein C7M61_004623 [[Candida] pseudohaemulonii]PSK35378.1 hypothetical protein C7M61_004623 [[Candida] pseudohaemulonii]
MEETIRIAKGYACKSVKYGKNGKIPWLTHVQLIGVNDTVAHLEPSEDPMVAIGRAFTRNLWDLGLLDDYVPSLNHLVASTHTCVLNLLFASRGKPYNLNVAFHYGEREPYRELSVVVSDRDLAELMYQRVVEGNRLYLAVEARARYLLKLNSVTCSMNGLELIVA